MSELENDLIPLSEKDKQTILAAYSLDSDYFESTSAVLLPKLPDSAIRLQELRSCLGKTQAELADELGILQPNVAAMESGKRPVGKYIKRTIFQTYKVNPVWWETGQGAILVKEI